MKKLLATATLVLALSPLFGAQVALAGEMPGSKYYESVRNVLDRGLMKNGANENFEVDKMVTRSEVMYAIARAANLSPKDSTTVLFRDIRKNNPAFKEITAAAEEDLLEAFPTERNLFSPKAKVTAGQALDALYRAFDGKGANDSGEITLRYEIKTPLPDQWSFTNDVRRAVKESALLQKADGTLYLDPTQNMTRGDFASLLYRFTESRKEGISFGLASWYGDGLSKVKVADEEGKALLQKFMTCAHRDLPIGTIVKVTNQLNGKSVNVVVNDRGPYVAGRVIDLSRSAFAAIENVGSGTTVVKIEVVKKPE